MPAARATASPADAHGSAASSNGAATMPQTTAPNVIRSGNRNVLASMSAPATINAPSTVEAMAAGQGNDSEDTSAMVATPTSRTAAFGYRSSFDPGVSPASRSIINLVSPR